MTPKRTSFDDCSDLVAHLEPTPHSRWWDITFTQMNGTFTQTARYSRFGKRRAERFARRYLVRYQRWKERMLSESVTISEREV